LSSNSSQLNLKSLDNFSFVKIEYLMLLFFKNIAIRVKKNYS